MLDVRLIFYALPVDEFVVWLILVAVWIAVLLIVLGIVTLYNVCVFLGCGLRLRSCCFGVLVFIVVCLYIRCGCSLRDYGCLTRVVYVFGWMVWLLLHVCL